MAIPIQRLRRRMGMSKRAVEKHLVRAMAHCQQAYRFDDSDVTDGGIESDDRSLGE